MALHCCGGVWPARLWCEACDSGIPVGGSGGQWHRSDEAVLGTMVVTAVIFGFLVTGAQKLIVQRLWYGAYFIDVIGSQRLWYETHFIDVIRSQVLQPPVIGNGVVRDASH